VYKIGKKGDEGHGAGTDFDVSTKEITPMGGFPHYGVIKEDYLMIKGAIPGVFQQNTALLQLASLVPFCCVLCPMRKRPITRCAAACWLLICLRPFACAAADTCLHTSSCCAGTKKRPITLRRSLLAQTILTFFC
jgi:hypothetical protein